MKKLLLILLTIPYLSFAQNCLEQLQELVGGIEFYKDFNITHFNHQKNIFKQQLQEGLKLKDYEANTPENMLALMEAHMDLIDAGGKNFEEIFQSGLKRRHRRILRAIETNLSKSTNKAKKLESIFHKLYLLNTTDNLTFLQRHLQKFKNAFSLEEFIKSRVAVAFANQSMEDALVELGFLKSPILYQKFKQWKLTKHLALETIYTGINNYFAMSFMSKFGTPIPVYLPKAEILKRLDFPKEVTELIINKGINGAYPLLKEKYGRLAQFELIYGQARKLYMMGVVPFFMWFSFEQSDSFEEGDVDFTPIEVNEDYFDRNNAIGVLFNEWRYQYQDEHGKLPDQEKLTEKWDELKALDDDALQKRYQEYLDKKAEEEGRTPDSVKPVSKPWTKFGPAFYWRF